VVLVTAGLVCVGLACVVGPDSTQPHKPYAEEEKLGNPIIGILLVLSSQFAVCMQWIMEEKLNTKHPIHPLLAIGAEGTCGFIVGIPILVAAHFLVSDVAKGFWQTTHCRPLFIGSLSLPLSIAFFNASGFAITKITGATARSTIDASRTVLVWVMCMYFGWETFKVLQFIGFLILVTGTMLYNNVIVIKRLLGEEEKAEMEGRQHLLLGEGSSIIAEDDRTCTKESRESMNSKQMSELEADDVESRKSMNSKQMSELSDGVELLR